MTTRRWAAALALLLLMSACGANDQSRAVVAAGTTLVDSGLMAELVAAYSVDHPDDNIAVIALSSSEAMVLASSGNADVLITHNKEVLDEYLSSQPASQSTDIFASTFHLVADPSITIEASSLVEALSIVAEREVLFVSRDDGSGTNAAERDAWNAANIDPSGELWYLRTGTAMGATLLVADQRHAATLTEHGAFLTADNQLSLLKVPNTAIPNPYQLTLVESASDAGVSFFEWISSPAGRAALVTANDELFGQQVYEF